MPMNKPHLEFTRVDMSTGWASPPGYPTGIKQKILASDLMYAKAMDEDEAGVWLDEVLSTVANGKKKTTKIAAGASA